MKRTVSWLTKLFVSSVVALALVITLGVQQAQADSDIPYCCTGEVTSLQPGEVCTVEYTEKYPFQLASLRNGFNESTVIVFSEELVSVPIYLDPLEVKKVSLPRDQKEDFVLRDGGPISFKCYK
ncbi:hypothetical protein [Okeania sp. SIO1I7]|uniref:hypothetical protein n=1 Tax=Okeania sp. SIO1I7 TaxID=2607772 RepID=UPI0013F95B10|nr:hypothetical protein [Okeania sp. SIO1I7]NET25361.1 hypothetical protein [Okeania sp. SIO1I7]